MKDQHSEVEAYVVRNILGQNRPFAPQWAVKEIMENHPLPDSDGADWYRGWTHEAIYAALTALARKFKQREIEPEPQMTMEGFKRIQKIYDVERDGIRVFVPVLQLTKMEVLAKASELLSFSSGAKEHAEELLRFHDDWDLYHPLDIDKDN